MRIQVLGCYGSEFVGEDEHGRRVEFKTSGFLVEGAVLVDAGTVTTGEPHWDARTIRQILLSHTHFDHIQALPFLADQLAGRGSITIHSVPEVLASLHEHLLNDRIWPDFTRLPSAAAPTFRLAPLELEQPFAVERLRATAVRVDHSVPTVGYILELDDAAVLYSGDTGETRRIWEVARGRAPLKAALIEASFPDEMSALAAASGHLTPRLLAREFAKLGRPDVPLYVYHLKPQYLKELRAQLRALGLPQLRLLEDGDRIVV